MPSIQVPIIRGEKTEQSDYVDFLPNNLYAVAKQVRGMDAYLISHDGLALHANTGAISGTGDRGGIYNERTGVHFRVIDSNLFLIGADGGFDRIGTIAGTDTVTFAYSFNSTLVVSGGVATRILDNFTLAPYERINILDACWISGYYVLTDGSRVWHTSAVNEAAIPELAFVTAEQSPDKTVGVMATQDGLLMTLDRYSIQYFYNAAGSTSAFAAMPAKTINAGIVGTHAKAMLLGDVFILGGRKNESTSVYIVATGDIKPVSTRSVDKIIASYSESELADAVLESRLDERSAFLLVRLKRHTLCFNYTFAQAAGLENAWSILSSGTSEAPWIGVNGVFDPRIGKWTYGDRQSGKVYTLDKENSAQDGQPVEWEFATPIIPLKGRVSSIEINTVSGYSTGVQSIFISFSSNMIQYTDEWAEVMKSKGNYGERYIINRVGFFADEFSARVRGVSTGKSNWGGLTINGG